MEKKKKIIISVLAVVIAVSAIGGGIAILNDIIKSE